MSRSANARSLPDTDPLAVRLLTWSYGVALRSLPFRLRAAYADSMRVTFRTVCRTTWRRHGARRTVSTAIAELLDLLRNAARERAGIDPTSPSPRRRFRGPIDTLSSWRADLRYALRSLTQRPGFTMVAVLTLALGIGASTAMFSVVDSALLRPLPFDRPQELATIWQVLPGARFVASWTQDPVIQWRDYDVFTDVQAFSVGHFDLTGGATPIEIQAARVTPGTLQFLGLQPAHGRDFSTDEGLAGAEPVVLLGDGLARQRFGTPESAVGSVVRLRDIDHRVIGVMPPGFSYPFQHTVAWLPMTLGENGRYPDINVRVYVRMKPGATIEVAQQQADAIAAAAGDEAGLAARVQRAGAINSRTRRAITLLLAAVGILVIIACANTANLLLARANDRQRETAIRAAIGAGRTRLIRQALLESLILALTAGVAGSLLAMALIGPILTLAPADVAILTANVLDVDLRALSFAFALSLTTVVLFGLLPAVRGSRSDLSQALAGGRGSTGGGNRRLRNTLVVAEIALSLVLLIVAGLLAGSYARLAAVDQGFETDGLLAVSIFPSPARYPTQQDALVLVESVRTRIAALPQVDGVGYGAGVPPNEMTVSFGITPEADGGIGVDPDTDLLMPSLTLGPGYLQTLGLQLLEGRDFDPGDVAERPQVTIVSQSLATRYWPGTTAIGKRFRLDPEDPWMTVVGVTSELRSYGAAEPFGPMEMYYPFSYGRRNGWFVLLLRSNADLGALAETARQIIWDIDPQQPINMINTMNGLVFDSLTEPVFHASLLGTLAVVAGALALFGVFSVVSYTVSQRRREIGIRVALGAGEQSVLRLILRSGLQLGLAGLALGTLAALALGKTLDTFLFDIEASDPSTILAVGLAMLVATLAACWLPARRALRVDPMETLRAE